MERDLGQAQLSLSFPGDILKGLNVAFLVAPSRPPSLCFPFLTPGNFCVSLVITLWGDYSAGTPGNQGREELCVFPSEVPPSPLVYGA